MRYSIAAGLLASSGAAAFSDSSPFVMYSTSSKFSPPSNPPQLQSTASVLATAQSLLSSCPTNTYLIFTHPNVHASDLRDPKSGACRENHLCAPTRYDNATKDWQPITGLYGVAEVVGPEIPAADLQSYIEDACAKKQKDGGSVDGATVLLTELDLLPAVGSDDDARPWAMTIENRLVGQIVESRKQFQKPGADDDDEYTVIYFAGPHVPSYQAQFNQEAGSNEVPLELRKRGWENMRADGGSGQPAKSAPLFVKYQFFTPGIFMGFVGAIIMIAMLYVGLSAVASLQVSYGAFDKEMGPAAQKKNS